MIEIPFKELDIHKKICRILYVLGVILVISGLLCFIEWTGLSVGLMKDADSRLLINRGFVMLALGVLLIFFKDIVEMKAELAGKKKRENV